jgi:hypothetical protein
MTAMEGRSSPQISYSPVYCCNDADELGELVHLVGMALRRKHVLGQVIAKLHSSKACDEGHQIDRTKTSVLQFASNSMHRKYKEAARMLF